MLEVPHSNENHRHVVIVGGGHDLIADGAAGLNCAAGPVLAAARSPVLKKAVHHECIHLPPEPLMLKSLRDSPHD